MRVHRWQKRWFVLNGTKLSYFSKGFITTKKGEISLEGSSLEGCPDNHIYINDGKGRIFKLRGLVDGLTRTDPEVIQKWKETLMAIFLACSD